MFSNIFRFTENGTRHVLADILNDKARDYKPSFSYVVKNPDEKLPDDIIEAIVEENDPPKKKRKTIKIEETYAKPNLRSKIKKEKIID
jgi:hypothetical protein